MNTKLTLVSSIKHLQAQTTASIADLCDNVIRAVLEEQELKPVTPAVTTPQAYESDLYLLDGRAVPMPKRPAEYVETPSAASWID